MSFFTMGQKKREGHLLLICARVHYISDRSGNLHTIVQSICEKYFSARLKINEIKVRIFFTLFQKF
jgi:hypothetical protein